MVMMDKEWLNHPRFSREYQDGERKFMDMAIANARNLEMMSCPCRVCQNLRHQPCDIVYEHLVIKGMDPTYTMWVLHREKVSASTECGDDEMDEMPETFSMYRDAFMYDSDVFEGAHEGVETERVDSEGVETELTRLLKEAETPLYPGCTKYTRMSAIVVLWKHKTINGLSDKSFDELLEIIGDMLPQDNTLPESVYSTKKWLKTCCLGYEKIHACVNDCCLFRKEKEKLDECPTCGTSRWKLNERSNTVQKGVPSKVLRYFPIIPRLRRMYMSPDFAEQLTWHSTHRSQDSKMRHPVDSLAWHTIDHRWPSFASEPRNIRLGLASDGFNPFANLSSTYSCWPVLLVTYNLPPWLCMRKENIMLTLLIPGPKQPGNDIDVYLEPLLDDLKELWNNCVEIYDAKSNSRFNLKAVLMWTINDFPAYANLSSYSTKGKKACPVCGVDTSSEWLYCSHKHSYMGHRRCLPHNHYWRFKKSWFDGTVEDRSKPRPVSSGDLHGVQ